MEHSVQDASEVEFLCKPAGRNVRPVSFTATWTISLSPISKAKRREILRFLTYRTQQLDVPVVSVPTKKKQLKLLLTSPAQP